MLTLYIFLYICYIRLSRLRFLSCSLSLFVFEFCFRALKGIGSSFYNYITYSTSFFLHLVTSCVVFSPIVDEVSILLRFFKLSLAFNNFCCVLYFFDFVIVFKF